MADDKNSQTRLIAKILRELLMDETFATYADLTDAVKYRLVALKIPATGDDISAAYALVESNRRLVPLPANLDRRHESRDPILESPTFNKSDAAAVYRQLMARWRKEQPARPAVPSAPEFFPALVRVK